MRFSLSLIPINVRAVLHKEFVGPKSDKLLDQRTTSTGRSAYCTTVFETEPSSSRANFERPRSPTTMRSTWCLSALIMIYSAGCPTATWNGL